MKIFFQNKTAKVFYEPETDALILEYISSVANDNQIIEISTALLQAFEALHTQKFVADIRKMGIISLQAQSWVANNLLPRMIKHLNGKKLYHAQLLDPEEIKSKVAAAGVKNRASKIAENFEIKQFSDQNELKLYLKTCGTTI